MSAPFAVEDWTSSSGASLRSGMMRNGIVYPLPPLALLTGETASGYWPTPQASDEKPGQASRVGDPARHGGWNLRDWVKLWPTPTTEDGESKGMSAARMAERGPDNLASAVKLWPTPTVNGNNNRAGLSPNSGDGLATAVKLWPTPTTRDWKDGSAQSCVNVPVKGLLGRAVHLSHPPSSGEQLPNAVGGVLNPEWVERMMGYPPGYTDIRSPSNPGKGTPREPSAAATPTDDSDL